MYLKKTEIQQYGSRVGRVVGSVHGNDYEGDDGGIVHQYKGFKGPKMPAFDEAKDDLDSYIQQFERYAEVQKWNAKDRAVFLSALLRGKALDVYSRLPVEDAMNYDTLKMTLLKRFQLTEDGFKEKFRTAHPKVGESPLQFIVRLSSFLERWVELAGVKKTYDGM